MIVRLSNGKEIPMEMHKVRIAQKSYLLPIDGRLKAIEEGGYNIFSLRTKDIFMDSLTDSGTNAMSDNQLATMMGSNYAYDGSENFYKGASPIKDVLGFKYVLPMHQGRAAEHLLAKVHVIPGDINPMNYFFNAPKTHFALTGALVSGINKYEHGKIYNTDPFRRDLDLQEFKDMIKKYGKGELPFVREEVTTSDLLMKCRGHNELVFIRDTWQEYPQAKITWDTSRCFSCISAKIKPLMTTLKSCENGLFNGYHDFFNGSPPYSDSVAQSRLHSTSYSLGAYIISDCASPPRIGSKVNDSSRSPWAFFPEIQEILVLSDNHRTMQKSCWTNSEGQDKNKFIIDEGFRQSHSSKENKPPVTKKQTFPKQVNTHPRK